MRKARWLVAAPFVLLLAGCSVTYGPPEAARIEERLLQLDGVVAVTPEVTGEEVLDLAVTLEDYDPDRTLVVLDAVREELEGDALEDVQTFLRLEAGEAVLAVAATLLTMDQLPAEVRFMNGLAEVIDGPVRVALDDFGYDAQLRQVSASDPEVPLDWEALAAILHRAFAVTCPSSISKVHQALEGRSA